MKPVFSEDQLSRLLCVTPTVVASRIHIMTAVILKTGCWRLHAMARVNALPQVNA